MIIELKAYLPSVGEYDECFKKYRAFVSAKVNDKAEKNRAFESDNYSGNGYYFMRSALAGSSDRVYFGDDSGVRDCRYGYSSDAGLRVAFQLIYNPKSATCQSCQIEKRTTTVYDDKNAPLYSGYGKDKKITSEAPIVEFDGKKCIWLNKEECESGVDKTMKLWTLELVDCAVPFDREGNHNDFAKATEIQDQCLGLFSIEAQKELVMVRMSSEDNYESATPVNDESDDEAKVKKLFEEIYEGNITEEDLRQGLLDIINEIKNSDSSTEEDAVKLGEIISSEMKTLEEKLKQRKIIEQEAKRKADAKNDAFDKLASTITNLKIGEENE